MTREEWEAQQQGSREARRLAEWRAVLAQAEADAYKAAERAEATRWTPRPREWAFGIGWIASKFLIQNDADAWMDEHVNPILFAGTEMGPEGSVDTIPDAATVDGLYEFLWAEIIRGKRWRGPRLPGGRP